MFRPRPRALHCVWRAGIQPATFLIRCDPMFFACFGGVMDPTSERLLRLRPPPHALCASDALRVMHQRPLRAKNTDPYMHLSTNPQAPTALAQLPAVAPRPFPPAPSAWAATAPTPASSFGAALPSLMPPTATAPRAQCCPTLCAASAGRPRLRTVKHQPWLAGLTRPGACRERAEVWMFTLSRGDCLAECMHIISGVVDSCPHCKTSPTHPLQTASTIQLFIHMCWLWIR